MAGYLMNMSDWASIESCVKDGVYSTRLPKLKGSYFLIPHEATFADYLSMKPGDNIYFFNDRIIYGIGELVDIQGDCKFLSHIGADSPRNLSGEELESTRPLLPYSQEYYRCFCVFKPSPLFFTEGVDMDEALNSNPQAFRIPRAMWKVSFIKMGGEENKAETIIRQATAAMVEKGYNPVNQLVGYLLSGDPAYVTSYKEARSLIRKLERDELLEELVRSYLEKLK